MTTELEGPFVVERRGCRLHYWTAGQGPALVFTHGYTMDHRMFDLQVQAFRSDHRVLVWDVRGHGLSKPIGDEFAVPVCAEDLAAVLDDAGISRATHVGHSMGGYIAQELAFRQPARMRSMVMLSTTCLTWRPPRVQTLGGPITQALLGAWPHSWTTSQIGWIAGLSSRARHHAVEAASCLSKQERTQVWGALLGAYHHEADYRIDCPVLIMHGQWDVVVGAGLIRALASGWTAREPNGQSVVIPWAAHNANQDNPEYTNQAIRSFLEAHQGDAIVAQEALATTA